MKSALAKENVRIDQVLAVKCGIEFTTKNLAVVKLSLPSTNDHFVAILFKNLLDITNLIKVLTVCQQRQSFVGFVSKRGGTFSCNSIEANVIISINHYYPFAKSLTCNSMTNVE